MDQYIDNRQKEILWNLLANPADSGVAYITSLERLVKDNPQSGLLQVLLARAGNKENLSRAAVYYNPRTLHKIVKHPEDIAVVDSSAIISPLDNEYNFHLGNKTQVEENEIAGINSEASITDDTFLENQEYSIPDNAPHAVFAQDAYLIDEHEAPASAEAEAVAAESINEIAEAESGIIPEATVYEAASQNDDAADKQDADLISDVDANLTPSIEEEERVFGSRFPKRNVVTPEVAEEQEEPQSDIEDEVYDEIVGIEDIGFDAGLTENSNEFSEARFSDPTVEANPEEEEASALLFHQPHGEEQDVNNDRSINEEEERLILGGIVNADYLLFDKKIDALRSNPSAEELAESTSEQAPPAEHIVADKQEVSRYDDDKMPYTFLWWLNKTRKEHSGTLQPYAKNNPIKKDGEVNRAGKMSSADELQQQYYENIFSITSVNEVDNAEQPIKVEFDHNKKEDVIIERFIHTEPQIKPLSADKLDNENKAKKSSEDQGQLVTETLAKIYIDQMLYHKAIATYKKLILKYPEKKLYFAAQIEQLEKKTN